MIFTYSKWEHFCEKLAEKGFQSLPAKDIDGENPKYIVLKHDVETDVAKALKMAAIEQKHGHRGSYYVQAYLLNDEKNVVMLKKMQKMGHEISYHYDVMDSCKGDLEKAIIEFDGNVSLFESKGFKLKTLCQHGNPIVERVGYTSNRDFFRNEEIQKIYSDMSDIMVNYKSKYGIDYLYFSDAGRHFQLIYDPINNDVINSDDKNVLYNDIEELFEALSKDGGNIVSTHPHRWTNSALSYILKASIFNIIKKIAKLLTKIPLFKRIMSKYYYLAKKI